jgi:hypothetical protein
MNGSHWLKWLLWPQQLDGQSSEMTLRAYPLLGTAGTIAAGIGLVILAIWISRAKGLDLSSRKRMVLASLRIAAVACLVPMLLDLSLQIQVSHQLKPTLAVAVDTSQSMSLQDRYAAGGSGTSPPTTAPAGTPASFPAGVSRIDLARQLLLADRDGQGSRLEQLSRSAELLPFSFDRTARPAGINSESPGFGELHASAPYTALTPSIDEMVERLRGRPTAGVLLLSDGASNTGGSPLAASARWRQAGVPVHTVTVGDADPRDIEVRQVLANDLLFSDDPATVVVRLRQRGYQTRRMPVILRSGSQELGRADAVFGENAGEINATITFTPRQAGEHTFRVEVPPQPDETAHQNNHRSFVARVTTDKIRVLYLEGRPRWQYRFLRDAMNRDRRLKLQVLLTGAEPVANPPPPLIASLPNNRDAFKSYDVFIIGDVDPGILTAQQIEWIGAMVRDEGAGMMLLAGPSFNPQAYAETSFADLFPIEATEEVGPSPRRPRSGKDDLFVPELTPLGQTHSAIQLGDDMENNLEQWKALPGVYWFVPVRKARPGALVLAVHPTEMAQAGQNEHMPIMAVQNSGKGKSFFCGIDETWRWRFKQGDRVFYRLWGQVIQYLGAPHLGGESRQIHLWTDRSVYNRNDTALVTVRAEELAGTELPVLVTESEDGRQQKLPLTPSPGAEHMFEARVPLTTAGLHKLWVDGHALDASAIVEVQAPQLELAEPAANPGLMKEIADNTGGQSGQAADIDSVIAGIDLSPRSIHEQRDYRLWDKPILVLILVSLLAADWVLRRLWQLP